MKFPLPLTDEQRLDLLCKAKNGDDIARNKLILSYLRFATTIAKKETYRNSDLDEQVAIAFYALVKTINSMINKDLINLKMIPQRIQGTIRNARITKTPSQFGKRRGHKTLCVNLDAEIAVEESNLKELIELCTNNDVERNIVNLLVEGKTFSEIAEEMQVPYRKVLSSRDVIKSRLLKLLKS